MGWFDSHCHLELCEGGAAAALERARAAGVASLLTVGIDIASSRRCAALAGSDGVYAAVGVHPNDCDEFSDEDAAALEELVRAPGVVAVGETGLDLYRDTVPLQRQAEVFDFHIALAARSDRALVIHTRRSATLVLDRLEAVGPPRRLVFHCWSGDEAELRRALELGAYIGFAGNVSFRSADDLRAAAVSVPADRLVVETDAPFLTPEPHRGRPNEPANVVHVGAALAAARGEDASELARRTDANAQALLGLR